MRRDVGVMSHGLGLEVLDRAYDFHAKRTGPAIQLLDPDEGAHRLRLQQDALGDAFGQRFQQVQALFGQFGGNCFGHLVVAQDAIHVVVDRRGHRAHLDHHVEGDALGRATLGLKRADLDLDHVIADRDPVKRALGGGGVRAL